MAEFSGKQFYGFSMHNDPELSTTTKNFEFRYTRPEFLEKAIQKVQSKDDIKTNPKNIKWFNYGRMRSFDVNDMKVGLLRRDADVETHMDRILNGNHNRIRNLSDKEIDHLIGKAKSQHSIQTTKICLQQTYDPEHTCTDRCSFATNNVGAFMSGQSGSEQFTDAMDDMEGSLLDNESMQRRSCIQLAEIRKPRAQWVEIVESNCKGFRLEINVKDTPSNIVKASHDQQGTQQNDEQRQKDYDNENGNGNGNENGNDNGNSNDNDDDNGNGNATLKYFDLPLQNYEPHCLPAILMNEVLTDNIRSACALNVGPLVESTTSTYTAEDSDLEYELQSRPNYFKLCKKRPKIKETKRFSKPNINASKFEEVENDSNDADTRYLRNMEPLQFTEITEEIDNRSNNSIKVAKRKEIKKKKTRSMKLKGKMELMNGETLRNKKTSNKRDYEKFKENRITKSRSSTPRQQFAGTAATINTQTATTPSNSGLEDLCNSKPASYTKYPLMNATGSKTPHKDGTKSKTKRRSRALIVSKSIEDLKAEKAALFSKMTNTQERIIEVLDKLRLNLLDLNIPENSYEKTKRQKNAFEFCVRFSRNFLYPLKGMLHELEFTPEGAFTSVTSNDACNRIYNIYNLLLQSLITYQKQLRYFLLDQVPQKLTTLIEMTHNAVTLCLSKKIFSPQDLVIDCLQQRCAKFIEFLTDMHEGRLEMVRQNYRKLTLEKAHSKYDLKMFMNDLNMYEPKLVPKTASDKPAKRKLKTVKTTNSGHHLNNDSSHDVLIEKPTDEKIFTQIQDLEKSRSSASIINTTSEEGSRTVLHKLAAANPSLGDIKILDKNLIEALQHITKEQVRQILEPIFDTLGSAIGNQICMSKEHYDLFVKVFIDNIQVPVESN